MAATPVQVALKASRKQLLAAQEQLKALQAAAATTAAEHRSSRSSANGSASSTADVACAAAAAAAAAEDAAASRHKLAQLEGALRQASSDYQLILAELGRIRSEGSSRQAQLEEALAGRAAAQAEVARSGWGDVGSCASLQEPSSATASL
jgi:hypothetical protein